MGKSLCVILFVYVCGAAPAAAQDWKTYTSKEGRFSVLWPGEPTITHTTHPQTGTVKTRYEAESPGSSIQFLFMDVADLPAEEVKKNGFAGTMGVIKAAMKSGLKATVLSEKAVQVGKAKYAGKDLFLRLPDKTHYVRVRLCLAGTRLYALTLGGSKTVVQGELARQVFESFTPTE